jgi:hypothetical protein
MFRLIIAVLALGLLAACASLTKNECATGDWYSVGLEDGAKGRLTSFFGRHVKACSKHGVTPIKPLWLDGRERGLVTYCTPQNAYRIGRSGNRINSVCAPSTEAAMVAPHSYGLRYYDLTQEIASIEAEIDVIDEQLALLTELEPLYIAFWLDRTRLEREIRRLERQRRKFSRWP